MKDQGNAKKTENERGQEDFFARLACEEGCEVVRVLREKLRACEENAARCALPIPPVAIGDTVYAMLYGMGEGEAEEIEAYTVRGLAYEDGKWYARGEDGEEFLIGSALCLTSLSEARERLRREKSNEESKESKELKESKESEGTLCGAP